MSFRLGRNDKQKRTRNDINTQENKLPSPSHRLKKIPHKTRKGSSRSPRNRLRKERNERQGTKTKIANEKVRPEEKGFA